MKGTSCHFLAGALVLCPLMFGQSVTSGTISGVVTDPTGAAVPGAGVELKNPVTGYSQAVMADSQGAFRFNNVPQNPYRLTAAAPGFATSTQNVEVRGTVPMTVNLSLRLAEKSTSVTVDAAGELLEIVPFAHQDVDRSSFLKLPISDPGGGLNQAITYSTGGVAADANGFFHPLGDHAQTTMVIDGQPISDQQSKVFSIQIPDNAIQSMELITGSPEAQYGDKTSLIVNATTRSGLGVDRSFGEVGSHWGSFGTWGGNAALGWGGPRFGSFIAVNGTRSGRFMDTPEFLPIHDRGNHGDIFSRLDWQPNANDILHLNLFAARNWFQVPNRVDTLSQDQRQRVLSWSASPSYQHTVSPRALLTINPYVRRDQVNYHASRNPFADTPATASQGRFLTNYGFNGDISYARGRHVVRAGTQLQQTRLVEGFQFGITDPDYNPVCLDAGGHGVLLAGLMDPALCATINSSYSANPKLMPGIVPFDLTRGGSLFLFRGKANINRYSFYVTDTVKLGDFGLAMGLRGDQYNGLSSAGSAQPRLGVSYHLPGFHAVLRAAYARTFETPFNENLVLSSGTGGGGLARNVFEANSVPIEPGRRNQFNAGMQHDLGRWLVLEADYFWKYTHNAYDFAVFFNTPIAFPVAWHNSKLDGLTARASTVNLRGFQASLTLGHSRARFFPPEVGGLVPLGGFPGEAFRIDHDQAYQHTLALRYQRRGNGEWVSFVWRYDSGMAVSGVADAAAALELTGAQQVAIGYACDGRYATYSQPINACGGTGTSKLLTLPAPEAADGDHNPNRVKPRSLLSLGLGSDNLTHKKEGGRLTLHVTIENLTNKVSLYNFLSTFSGTNFVAPRTVQVSLGYAF